MNTKRGVAKPRWWMAAVAMAVFLAGSTPSVQAQRDPGLNQPGAAGNVGRDPGINQPGAVGNVGGSARQTRAVADPGINQPGAAGNVGRDPGRNQPGQRGTDAGEHLLACLFFSNQRSLRPIGSYRGSPPSSTWAGRIARGSVLMSGAR
jgi:hypothetical protein